MAATKELRAFLGRLSWIAGNCPKTEVDGDSHVRGSHQRAAGRRRAKTDVETHVQSMDFFAVKRLGTAMPWLKAAFRDTRDHVDQKGAASGTRADVVLSQTLHPAELGVYLSTEWAPSGTLWRLLPVQPHQATALEIEFNKPGRVRSPLSIANLEPKAARRASAHQVR